MVKIVETEGILGGKPRIEGTRVSAEQVYEMYTQAGLSPDEIADRLPSVSLAGVHAAIEYMESRSDGAAHADAVA